MTSSCSNNDNHSIDDVIKICPLCNAAVRYFFLNFTEKVLMCESDTCIYPFGIEELKYIVVDNDVHPDLGAPSSTKDNNKSSLLHAPSSTSSTCLLKNDKLTKASNIEENKVLNLRNEPKSTEINIKPDNDILNDKGLQSLHDLRSLSKELNQVNLDLDDGQVIKKEKWLKKLMKLEGSSGSGKLVKKQEMEILKQKSPFIFGGGELRIDIDTNRNNMSSINIQIVPKDDSQTKSKAVT